MEIVAPQYRKTKAEVEILIEELHDNEFTPAVLLMVDYAYHNTDDDYDDGLSFLDRLYNQLSQHFDIRWNVDNMKRMIRASDHPSVTFLDVLNEILTADMVMCYCD